MDETAFSNCSIASKHNFVCPVWRSCGFQVTKHTELTERVQLSDSHHIRAVLLFKTDLGKSKVNNFEVVFIKCYTALSMKHYLDDSNFGLIVKLHNKRSPPDLRIYRRIENGFLLSLWDGNQKLSGDNAIVYAQAVGTESILTNFRRPQNNLFHSLKALHRI